jgi:diacylglycerol kinase family enzyme
LRTPPDLLAGHTGAQLAVRAGTASVVAPQAVLVSNNPYDVGDLAGLGRRRRLDEGTLGIVGVRVDNARQAASLLRGTATKSLTVTTAREVTVTTDAAEIPVGVDGEALVLRTPVRCRVRPGALRVRVPRDRPGRAAWPLLDWHRVWRLAVTGGPATVSRAA